MMEDNVDRSIFRCASLRFRMGVDSITHKSEEFHAILETTPVVETRVEYRWRREECGGITGLEFEALQIIFIVK